MGKIKIKKEYTFAAMPSSTIQQNFGETPDKHGYMLWDIINKKGELVEIQTEYTKLNFYIEPGFDYDNIDFKHNLMTDKSFIKVHWKDISANIDDDNEGKINKHFKKLGVTEEVIYEKNRIYTDISDSELLTENIDINNKSVQQKIFRDYLTLNGYDIDFIEEIIKIDDIVEELIEDKKEQIQSNWKIDKFWLDNFKSYENIEIEWNDMNGIIQLYSEENQQGKTTLLDGICYITHGTTLSTNKIGGAKKEKNGDQRYINNKRDLDYCNGGMIMDINNKKYAIVRETIREWSKGKKKVTSAKTTVSYYRDGIIDDDHLLTGETRNETQKMLDDLFVDFNDFIRLTLINSFNINELIAMDRATFIDSIIKDAGYNVFEKKLDVFKKYKKTLSDDRINIDIDETNEELENLKISLKENKEEYKSIKKNIDVLSLKIVDILKERDIEYRKFNQVDDDILNIDMDDIENKISTYKVKKETNTDTISINSKQLSTLKSSYDEEKYESLLKDTKTIDDNILQLKLKISQVENKELTLTTKLENIEIKKSQLVKDKINDYNKVIDIYNYDIDKIKSDFDYKIDEKKRSLNTEKTELEFSIKTENQELSNIKEKGISIKSEIKELENSKICPTCLREYDADDHEHLGAIENKKTQLEKKISDLMVDVKGHKKNITEFELEIEKINNVISEIEKGIYPDDFNQSHDKMKEDIVEVEKNILKIKSKIKKLEQNDLDDLTEDFEKLDEFEIKIKDEQQKNISLLSVGKKKLKEKEIELDKVEKEIQILKVEKDEVKRYNTISTTIEQAELQNEKIDLNIEKANNIIEKYNSNKKFIEQNKLINDKINEYDNELSNLESEKEDLNTELNDIKNDSNIIKEKGEKIKKDIDLYNKQTRLDNIHKIYQKCVHRDGIPFYLLMKSRDLINQELSDILSSVNFNVFFDENMNLKMFMEFAKDVIQNTLEGSGAEKAFSAIALKLALRSINNNSRPNFLLLDEVTGNLKGKSVVNFNMMLDKMKERIDKIIIIEQNHPINYEYGIEVIKDEKTGISSLKINK